MPLLFHRIPAAAVRTAAEPPWRLMSTGLARKDNLGFQKRPREEEGNRRCILMYARRE
ncbi:hypothetical protein COMA2_40194 [Candidatus Nitrospira nitrificans]|uniref:Uncharacterized protein n=1 Tax=Candidatus Nitrospira nitrificans TaxID=1742973 RepID=A0A0S4LSP4_9BACT|nr:hypothetical protein COMA2_40194 [Candidatus Nitrospira nitrificans]